MLEAGAAIDAVVDDGRTALFMASMSGHEACVRALIEHAADTSKLTTRGDSALMIAEMMGHATICDLLKV